MLVDINDAKTWRTAYYTRLSREDDGAKSESESIISQRQMLDDFLGKNLDLVKYDEYVDDGYSGSSFARPAFLRLINDISEKKVNCVIVKDLSRFGREIIDATDYIQRKFPAWNVRFIAINDNIDSYKNPDSIYEMSLPIKNLMNDEYCHDISKKVRSALNIRRKHGQFIGSFACYGYLKDSKDHHKLVIDEVAADNIKMIFNMFLSGKSLRGIALYLNEHGILTPSEYKKSLGLNYRNTSKFKPMWDSTTIRRILSNEMLIGNMVQKQVEVISYKIKKLKNISKDERIIVEGTHEAIIPKDVFENVQAMLKKDTKTQKGRMNVDLLSGFVKCGDCKRGMHIKHMKSGKKEYDYYVCSSYKKGGRSRCTSHTIDVNAVKNAVFETIKKNITLAVNIDKILECIDAAELDAHNNNRFEKLIETQKKKRNIAGDNLLELYPALKADIITREMYNNLKERYTREIEECDRLIQEYIDEIDKIKNGITRENRFVANFKKYKNITELTRNILSALVENIYVYEDKRIEIEFKFKDEFETAVGYLSLAQKLNNLNTNNNQVKTFA